MVDLKRVSDIPGLAEEYKVSPSSKLLQYDFVLVTEDEVNELRHRLAVEAIEKQGIEGLSVVNGLPVPNVD